MKNNNQLITQKHIDLLKHYDNSNFLDIKYFFNEKLTEEDYFFSHPHKECLKHICQFFENQVHLKLGYSERFYGFVHNTKSYAPELLARLKKGEYITIASHDYEIADKLLNTFLNKNISLLEGLCWNYDIFNTSMLPKNDLLILNPYEKHLINCIYYPKHLVKTNVKWSFIRPNYLTNNIDKIFLNENYPQILNNLKHYIKDNINSIPVEHQFLVQLTACLILKDSDTNIHHLLELYQHQHSKSNIQKFLKKIDEATFTNTYNAINIIIKKWEDKKETPVFTEQVATQHKSYTINLPHIQQRYQVSEAVITKSMNEFFKFLKEHMNVRCYQEKISEKNNLYLTFCAPDNDLLFIEKTLNEFINNKEYLCNKEELLTFLKIKIEQYTLDKNLCDNNKNNQNKNKQKI